MYALSSLNAHSLTRGNRVLWAWTLGQTDNVEIVDRVGRSQQSPSGIWIKFLSGTEVLLHPNQKMTIVL